MKRSLDVDTLINAHTKATEIANKWEEWQSFRRKWLEEKKELRNYVYATDTRTTSNSKLPWSNSTTTPKLTQIYDNLKANYTATLFPNSNWMKWKANDQDSATEEKRKAAQDYMDSKLAESRFRSIVDQLIDDFILTGNCFGTVDWSNEVHKVGEEDFVAGYLGPRLVRVSPYDISFDPTATDFAHTPKIVRTIKTLGEVANEFEGTPELEEIFGRMLHNRSEVGAAHQTEKSNGYIADGFSSLENYYQSSYVEFLTFYGDIFDRHEQKLHKNRIITVVDRAYVLNDIPNPSWLGTAPIFHAGWRTRPDNLYAMGPLDNLVGMQYRIDHLENLKADVFDQIALPMLKIRGDVEDFEYEPGGRIFLGEEGDVGPLVPDSTALNADFQISSLENKMEEMAGAPRMAMGIRTPGEKTAFEVQTLENAANRIFTHKASKFEEEFLEPVLNAMLESARRNLQVEEEIISTESDDNLTIFNTITREDLVSKGRLIPMGARHFAERAQRVQSLNQLIALKNSDPSIAPHISGKELARILSEELREPAIFGENIAVFEQSETQSVAQDAEADAMEQLEVKAEQGL